MTKYHELFDPIEDITNLKKRFEIIQKQGWVKGRHNGFASIGRTFESLMGLEENSFQFPDFGSIEIKTHYMYSNQSLGLFKVAFDSNFFESERIKNNYGYPDRILRDCKVLYAEINGKNIVNVGFKYKLYLHVNRDNERIYLLVFDRYDRVIDSQTYWSFSLLKERLYDKLTLLAYVEADRRFIGNETYFRYGNIKFYRLRSFETFLNLIENGQVTVKLCLGVFREGKRKGQMHDHGTGFCIKSEDLHLLFSEVNE